MFAYIGFVFCIKPKNRLKQSENEGSAGTSEILFSNASEKQNVHIL